jgi:hypothetical protein
MSIHAHTTGVTGVIIDMVGDVDYIDGVTSLFSVGFLIEIAIENWNIIFRAYGFAVRQLIIAAPITRSRKSADGYLAQASCERIEAPRGRHPQKLSISWAPLRRRATDARASKKSGRSHARHQKAG